MGQSGTGGERARTVKAIVRDVMRLLLPRLPLLPGDALSQPASPAQTYPVKPIRIIVPFPAAGTEKFASQGADALQMTPDEFSAFMRSETATRGKVVEAAGVRAD
jgi:tripartite-type tricarboxylate transporter receptor subunit TctC